ncbi:MAG: hypothetical protein ACI4L2_04805 [Wujia sp.]
MDIFIWIFFIVEAVIGVGSILCIVVTLFGTLFYKIYRKIKYGISLYD